MTTDLWELADQPAPPVIPGQLPLLVWAFPDDIAAWIRAHVITPRVPPRWQPPRTCSCAGRSSCGACSIDRHAECWGPTRWHETWLLSSTPGFHSSREIARVWLADRVCGHPCACTVCETARHTAAQGELFEVAP